MSSPHRARALVITLCVLLVPLATIATAQDLPGGLSVDDPEDTGAFGLVSGTALDVVGPIGAIVAPTNGAPAFALAGQEIRVELRFDTTDELGLPGASGAIATTLTLAPSFGDGTPITVAAAGSGPEPSQLWEGPYARDVIELTATLPGELAPGLYDLSLPDGDTARRALAVYDAWPETPLFVLVADTQTGDPRAMEDGFEEGFGWNPESFEPPEPDKLRTDPDPEPFNDALRDTLGIDLLTLEIDPSQRWAAYREAIRQINELGPDLVLFSGDLNFGQMVPSSFHVEYEEAYALINGGPGVDGTVYDGFHAPTLLSPGNHDAYVQNGEDGFAFWQAYFGPPAFFTTFSNITLGSINTYDWSELDRVGISLGVSAWGGQVRDPQLAWLREELCRAGGGTPTVDLTAIAGVGCTGHADTRVVTFAHHSPSWEQDIWHDEFGGFYEQCPCEGTPALEQISRGAITVATDGQAWSGVGRLELRDTLNEFNVDLHAAGHTHRDRMARDVGDGSIVETPQHARQGLDITQLHFVTRDSVAMAIDQALAMDLLRNGSGPLYIETTTTSSGTSQYWGYRPLAWHASANVFPDGALGIPPFETGYPMTRELLDEVARNPGRWNASHTAFGLYSTPTFLPP